MATINRAEVLNELFNTFAEDIAARVVAMLREDARLEREEEREREGKLPPGPHEVVWLTPMQCAALLGVVDKDGRPSARNFHENIACLYGFPEPLSLSGSSKGKKWKRAEVLAWADREQGAVPLRGRGR